MASNRADLKEAERRIAEAAETRDDYLILDDLRIDHIPESIGQLTWLTRFRCDGCGFSGRLKHLPDVFAELKKLWLVWIEWQPMAEFPKVLLSLPELRDLQLSRCKITTIPDEISSLTKLQNLTVAVNKIKNLPESIGDLTELAGIYIHGNPLQALPHSIGKLKKLRDLFLQNTQIRDIPKSVALLANLKYLEIEDCPNLPKEMVRVAKEGGIKAIQHYLLGTDNPDDTRFDDPDALNLPLDLVEHFKQYPSQTFEFEGAKNWGSPPFRTMELNDLQVEWFNILPFDGGPGGPWNIPIVNLIKEDGYPDGPAGIFTWLPDQKRFATLDSESRNLFVFHKQTTWPDIAGEFKKYFMATNQGGEPDPKFAVRLEDSDCFVP